MHASCNFAKWSRYHDATMPMWLVHGHRTLILGYFTIFYRRRSIYLGNKCQYRAWCHKANIHLPSVTTNYFLNSFSCWSKPVGTHLATISAWYLKHIKMNIMIKPSIKWLIKKNNSFCLLYPGSTILKRLRGLLSAYVDSHQTSQSETLIVLHAGVPNTYSHPWYQASVHLSPSAPWPVHGC